MRLQAADLARKGLRKERLQWLRGTATEDGTHVLYWMQTSLRTKFNFALEVAVDAASRLKQPLHILHTIETPATERHIAFLLESLVDVHTTLAKKNLHLSVAHGAKPSVEVALLASKGASVVIVDHPYLRDANALNQNFAQSATTSVLQVEGDAVVPVEHASDKEEHAARTIRPKITKLLDKYLVPLEPADASNIPESKPLSETLQDCGWLDMSQSVDDLLASFPSLDRSIFRVSTFKGGETSAQANLASFLKNKLVKYDTSRNEPSGDGSSNMSPYLHYGNISPVDIALQTKAFPGTGPALSASKAAFLEELIVRRELSMNFVWYNPRYDTFAALPAFAVQTLHDHADDARPHTYTFEQLDKAKTADVYWNAAQLDMILTGKMHNYMRMYWGKKIIEWTASPEDAFRYAIELNDKYNLDGYDPNSYTGIAWVFGKHDQGWKERPIFGKVRYMNAEGLERKFNMAGYIGKIRKLAQARGLSVGSTLTLPPAATKKRKR
ncbi:unnamed protein product [Aphanomyces euteiches]|uniref:Deoxyribodipyrimidine photo-lyase n=1 Tax=Aphanomyces euteiches TaxID=100861 RepID=A0A6G0XU97_9STRA|nr:hypothetical protein Ae201684_001648 [Aphanomyces euteiches]KAH9075452.1 hypothetical protein Ae201684P_004132 [Aphanomyces euteiches]KAH9132482.1 hypothetical protein AeRB84_021128 [Aphanomyces euteiches]